MNAWIPCLAEPSFQEGSGSAAVEFIELPLCDAIIPHLVDAHGYGPDGEGLEWLRFQRVHKATCTDTDGEMRMVVDAGAGSDEMFT